MKLWEIKAQALRLMFADTDIEFSFAEFENNSIYENANTREKLIRMNDSIRRAIDLYYHYHGEQISTKHVVLLTGEGENVFQYVDIGATDDVLRIDLLYKGELGDGKFLLQEGVINAPFFYDDNDRLRLQNVLREPERYLVRVWYKEPRLNLPEYVAELTFDLTELGLPEEIQRKIPFYIKGEIYEEDEAEVAQAAKNEYISFVITFKRNKPVQKQTKVRSRFQW